MLCLDTGRWAQVLVSCTKLFSHEAIPVYHLHHIISVYIVYSSILLSDGNRRICIVFVFVNTGSLFAIRFVHTVFKCTYLSHSTVWSHLEGSLYIQYWLLNIHCWKVTPHKCKQRVSKNFLPPMMQYVFHTFTLLYPMKEQCFEQCIRST